MNPPQKKAASQQKEEISKWAKPSAVTAPELAFGGDMQKLLPPLADIPVEFKDRGNGTKWNAIQRKWFFEGLPAGTRFVPKEGVDEQAALRHLGAIQRSWAPKHEHKEAGVSWLMSLWFTDIIFP